MKYFAMIPSKVLHDKELPPNAKLLYGDMLADCCGGRLCHLDYDEVSRLYGCAKSTIFKWLSALEKQGYIKKHCAIKDRNNKIYLQQIIVMTENT